MKKGTTPKTATPKQAGPSRSDKAFAGMFAFLKANPGAVAFVSKSKKEWFFRESTAIKHFGEGNFNRVTG
jgi:hypothetical protein